MPDAHIGVLLPARLETRFVEAVCEDEPGQPVPCWKLRIAVIPDEPWMNRHSDIVSAAEAERLATLWTACDDDPAVLRTTEGGRAAFRTLAQQVGPARAWWLATHFGPGAAPPVGQKPLSRMDTLPEQIEIWLGLDQDGDIKLERLEPPMTIHKPALVFDGTDGDALSLFGNGRWWTQEAGLQAEYQLPFSDEAGLEQIELIMAIGLGDGSPRELFESHRNAGLLSLLPLGAPTNTVSGEPDVDLAQDPDLWWRLLSNPGEEGTCQDLALALVGDPAAVSPLPGGTRGHRALNQELISLLWPSLWGHTLKDVWCVDQALGRPGLSFELGVWAGQWLHPEGPLAPMRIGDQPYGVWPATRLNDGAWKPADDDPDATTVVERRWMADWLPQIRKHWAEGARQQGGTVVGANTEAFVELLGRTPSASAYGYRTFMPLQVMYLLTSSLLGGGPPVHDWLTSTSEVIDEASRQLGFPVQPIRRYMTSGWRQDLPLPLVEPPRVTHVSGTNSGGVLYYDAATREGATAAAEGNYRFAGSISGFTKGWTHLVPAAGDTVFFYRSDDGTAALSRIDGDGNYQFVGPVPGVAAGWTHVAATANGGVLFYRAGAGRGESARLDEAGNYQRTATLTTFTKGWSHIVSAGQDGLLFYDALTGQCATSRIDGVGNYSFVGAVSGLEPGWTHLAATAGGGVLYYHADTGAGLSAWLDDAGIHHLARPVPGIGAEWTHVVGTGRHGLLFYNAATGAAVTAEIDGAGDFRFTGAVTEALPDGRSVFFEQIEHIIQIDQEHGIAWLFRRSDVCDPELKCDSLLMRLILNSIAVLQAEMGRMHETLDFEGRPFIEPFDPGDFCTHLQMWCENARELRIDLLFDDGFICDFLGLGADCLDTVGQRPVVRLYRSLVETLWAWREAYADAVQRVRDGEIAAVRQLLNDIERALRATLDTAAMRVDPWITGMAWRRLNKLRDEEYEDGLGLYAWVDKPYTGTPGPTEGGTLLAPSHEQLLTSIILRDKLINDWQADRWKIELDSRKVRLAKRFADEVRAGAHIQEVLGRAVEGVVGDKKRIEALRRDFRIREEHAGRRTCDGQQVLALSDDDLLLLVDGDAGRRDQLLELKAAVNSYADLLVANGVHAIVSGRPEKAGETMDAAAGLELPPELDVLRTPRTGNSVNTSVWLALPTVGQPEADDPEVSPALLADAAVATFLEQAVPTQRWIWRVQSEAGEATVTLADLGLRPFEALAYSEDALRQLAGRLGGGIVADDAADATFAHRQLRRLAALLSGHVHTAHNLPDQGQPGAEFLASLWEAHDAELRTRLDSLRDAAIALWTALDPEPGDPVGNQDALRRARRWGIAPAPLDDTLAPEDYRLTAEEQLRLQLEQARRALGDRITHAQALAGDAPLHQVAEALAELSGAALPIFGRAKRLMLEGGSQEGGQQLAPHPTLDQEWLEIVAAVRPALARLEAHQLGSERRWRAWCNHADPWTFVPQEADTRVRRPMNVVVCYSPSASLGNPEDTLAVAVLDSWSEMVPAKRHIVEAAFGFNAPSSRAPQAILLAVPPDELRPLDGETLAHIVLEARQSAHARMATTDDIAPYAALFPFAMLPAQQPTGVSMRPLGER